jgi:NAD+ synthase
VTALRIDGALVEHILTTFLREEIGSAGLNRAVVGLSGGIDSAISVALAARALGPDNVLSIAMPYKSSSPDSLADAQEVADSLGIRFEVVDITRQIDAYFEACPDANRMRRGNKMARERMTVLYDRSAEFGALVIGTSNKTELLLGYGTLHGDMASALNPIGDLYKTQVFMLAEHLELPRSVIDKPPSADLWSGQTDEEELGFAYDEVDAVLTDLVERRLNNSEMARAGHDPEFVDQIRHLIARNQFKRRMPIIAKLTDRTINADFRYPRDWGV